jgi:N-acetylglutamate synthase
VIRQLQERAARAFPAQHVQYADSWWLRYAPGCSWWIGSVLPHGGTDLERLTAEAEDFNAERGTVTAFQITPGVCAPELDGFLAARGYDKTIPVSLQAAPTETLLSRLTGLHRDAVVTDRPTTDWLDAWLAVHHGERDAERSLLARVPGRSAFVHAKPGAVGRIVVDDGWAGIFGMAVLPHARGSGLARMVLGTLAQWAEGYGAAHMYLQVERDNLAARRLYEKAGFTEVCEYHYRTSSGGRSGERSELVQGRRVLPRGRRTQAEAPNLPIRR